MGTHINTCSTDNTCLNSSVDTNDKVRSIAESSLIPASISYSTSHSSSKSSSQISSSNSTLKKFQDKTMSSLINFNINETDPWFKFALNWIEKMPYSSMNSDQFEWPILFSKRAIQQLSKSQTSSVLIDFEKISENIKNS